MADDDVNVDHEALVSDIRNVIDGKKFKPTKVIKKKTTKTTSDLLLGDLISSIKSTKNVANLKEDLEINTKEEAGIGKKKPKIKNNKLNVPLHRQEQVRVEAATAVKDLNKELQSWDPVVQSNRAAEQLFFPLNDPKTFAAEPIAEKAKSFVPRTSLELKLADLLGKSTNILRNDELYTEEEKELLKALDLKDAKKKTSQLQKLRAVMSYRAAKYARESKIKSKKYHRLRAREKRRKMIKEIEDLMASNPEAAKEKLKELETDRAYERATLKHRSTNKWSVQLKQYASKNLEMQKLITEHLSIGRELKKRHEIDVEKGSDDEEEEKEKMSKSELLKLAASQAQREIKKASEDSEVQQSLERVKANLKEVEISLDPTETLILEDNDDVANDQFLANAFDEDDVMAEFEEQKKEEEGKTKKKDEDNRLFGWGDWTGEGISQAKQSKRKEKFIKKAKQIKRNDYGNSKLIIRTVDNTELQKLQPKDVPFPFTAVKDFEAVIRQPIGRDWNTNLAHKELIMKNVVTKAGRIISSMDLTEKQKKIDIDDEFLEMLN